MVHTCCMVDCRSKRVKGSSDSFYKIPARITSQGAKTLEITTCHQNAWLVKIHRKN